MGSSRASGTNPPSDDGGWEITRYYYSDTGPRLHAGAPGKSCGDSYWPYRRFNPNDPPPSGGAGDGGRRYGVTTRVHLPPDGYTISISAINVRGEGACTAAPR